MLSLISENAGSAMTKHESQPTDTAAASSEKVDSSESKLLDAAVRVFMRNGYIGTSIREIAKQAGLTIGTLYHYADSKEALFLRLVNDGYQRSIAEARATAALHDDPEKRLHALVRSHVVGEVAERDLWRISRSELNALMPETRSKIIALRDAFESIWNGAILDGCNKGCFWPKDPTIARLSLVRMYTSVSDWYDPHGRLSLEEIVEIMYEQSLDLLRPRKGERSHRRGPKPQSPSN